MTFFVYNMYIWKRCKCSLEIPAASDPGWTPTGAIVLATPPVLEAVYRQREQLSVGSDCLPTVAGKSSFDLRLLEFSPLVAFE